MVSPNGMIDEENQTFVDNVFKIRLMKTSEGNLEPLKFPLKSIKSNTNQYLNVVPHVMHV